MRSTLPQVRSAPAVREIVLAVTSVGAFMVPFNLSATSVAAPVIAHALHLGLTSTIWVLNAYLVVVTALLVPAGRLADIVGRKPVYLSGVGVFAAGCLLSALAPSGSLLLAGQLLQGFGGAAISSNAFALITAAFPASERGRGIGVNTTALYVGLSLGPSVGGLLAGTVGWRAIYLVDVPIALATLWLGRRGLPEEAPPGGRFDLPGLVLLGLGAFGLLVGLTFGQSWGWTVLPTLACLVGGAGSLCAFVAAEAAAEAPLIPPSLWLKSRTFAAANLAALLNYWAFFAATFLAADYLQLVHGDATRNVGLDLLTMPAAMALLSPLTGRLSDRFGSRLLTAGGMTVMAAALASLALLPAGAGGSQVSLRFLLLGIGMGCFSAPNNSAVMGAVGPDMLGVAAGTIGTCRFFGQSLSFAVLGAVAAAGLPPAARAAVFSGARAQPGVAAALAAGLHHAFGVAAVFAVLGALVSLVRD